MTDIGVSRMFRAAIVTAMREMFADPRTMAAVDELAEPFTDIEHMLWHLWSFPGLEWNDLMGLEYSQRRQDAVLVVTGRPYREWTLL